MIIQRQRKREIDKVEKQIFYTLPPELEIFFLKLSRFLFKTNFKLGEPGI